MYDVAMLVFTAVAALGAVLTVLPLLGVDIRIWGRPSVTPFTVIDRPKKIWLALGLAVASVLLSGFATYHFFRPRIVDRVVEKIVEKPVDVPVPVPCPEKTKQPSLPPHKSSQSKVELLPGTTINAATNAPDSIAVGINTGTINKANDPNKGTITYGCGGQKTRIGPSGRALIDIQPLDSRATVGAFKEMQTLNNDAYKEIMATNALSSKYPLLLEKCQAQIVANPDWLTPYLFCGVAYIGMKNVDKANEMLASFDQKSGPGYDAGGCQPMVDFLRKAVVDLKQQP